jgi:NADH-quinone oxidoreductase subunit H
MFYVGEFLHAFTVSALMTALFFGGWRGPWAEQFPILGMAYFIVKAFIVYFFVIVLRISMPRLRIDQLLNFNWKLLTPIGLVLLMVTAIAEKTLTNLGATTLTRVGIHLLVNVLVAWGAVSVLGRSGRSERKRVAEPRPVATPQKS